MKILLKVSLSGVDFSYYAGEEADVDEAVAKQWVEADYAEEIKIATQKAGAKNVTTE